MSGLDEVAIARLRKVAGLFDSPVEPEFIAARSIAQRRGISLVEALSAALGRPASSTSRERSWSPEPVPPTAPWMRKVLLCRDAQHLFKADAREFLANMAVMRRAPSPAQMKWLDDLHARAVRHFSQGTDAPVNKAAKHG